MNLTRGRLWLICLAAWLVVGWWLTGIRSVPLVYFAAGLSLLVILFMRVWRKWDWPCERFENE